MKKHGAGAAQRERLPQSRQQERLSRAQKGRAPNQACSLQAPPRAQRTEPGRRPLAGAWLQVLLLCSEDRGLHTWRYLKRSNFLTLTRRQIVNEVPNWWTSGHIVCRRIFFVVEGSLAFASQAGREAMIRPGVSVVETCPGWFNTADRSSDCPKWGSHLAGNSRSKRNTLCLDDATSRASANPPRNVGNQAALPTLLDWPVARSAFARSNALFEVGTALVSIRGRSRGLWNGYLPFQRGAAASGAASRAL